MRIPDAFDLTPFGADAIEIARTLEDAGYEAVIVGGPVRDVLRGMAPNDVDLATSATPDVVRRLFRRTFVVGRGERHGTIGVLAPGSGAGADPCEVTTFRRDVETDGRHATVEFTTFLEEDLARRDFTINAMAVRPVRGTGDRMTGELVDPYGGARDLAAGVLRAVGDPGARFQEDYLRILRAWRFSASMGLTIEPETRRAMREALPGLEHISRERIRDELFKMFARTRTPGRLAATLHAMLEDGALEAILPEVARCSGVTQNRHHAFDVATHLFHAADAAPADRPLLRFAMLLHDIGKPSTKTTHADGSVHFYGHESVGQEMADEVCRRLRLSADERDWVTEIVAQHMRLLDAKRGLSDRALRRIARDLKSGVTLEDLLDARLADKGGSGVSENQLTAEEAAALREQIRGLAGDRGAFGIKDLAIDGNTVMEVLDIPRGPEVGARLKALLDAVIDEPAINTRETLIAMLEQGKPPAQQEFGQPQASKKESTPRSPRR